MSFGTRFLSYTLLALLVLQGQLLAVRAGDDDGPGAYGGNGGNGDDGGAQGAGWPGKHQPGPPPPGPPPPGPPSGHPGPNPPNPPPGRPSPPGNQDGQCQVLWGQCGGYGYKGTTKCPPGSYCRWFSDWYSQCNPNNN